MKLKATILLLLLSLTVQAQKLVTVEAEYTYHAPENQSPAEAKRVALERAKIQALAEKFGTVVSQFNTTRVENRNGESKVDYRSDGGSTVKGEWIETVGEPRYTIAYQDDMLVITVRVKGKAREATAKTDLKVHVLRNHTDDGAESAVFKNGDQLFLSFQSPIDGYLAVYLADAEDNLFCLLPYGRQSDGVYPVRGGEHYVLFCPEKAKDEAEKILAEEYCLYTTRSAEDNMLYVVFSPSPFTKANDVQKNTSVDLAGTAGQPRELPYTQFSRWLVNLQKHDIRVNVLKYPITIKK